MFNHFSNSLLFKSDCVFFAIHKHVDFILKLPVLFDLLICCGENSHHVVCQNDIHKEDMGHDYDMLQSIAFIYFIVIEAETQQKNSFKRVIEGLIKLWIRGSKYCHADKSSNYKIENEDKHKVQSGNYHVKKNNNEGGNLLNQKYVESKSHPIIAKNKNKVQPQIEGILLLNKVFRVKIFKNKNGRDVEN